MSSLCKETPEDPEIVGIEEKSEDGEIEDDQETSGIKEQSEDAETEDDQETSDSDDEGTYDLDVE